MIPLLCLGWSIATFLTPLGAASFPLMLGLRFLVGAFEAPIVPAMSITNAVWVPRHELARSQIMIPAALSGGIMVGYPLVTIITVQVAQTNNWALPFYVGVSAQPLFGETAGETTEPVAEIEHTSG